MYPMFLLRVRAICMMIKQETWRSTFRDSGFCGLSVRITGLPVFTVNYS